MIIASNLSPVETNNNSKRETNNYSDPLISKQFDFGDLSTDQAFQVAKDFLKAKDGTKAVQMTYDDRNMIYVLMKQIKNKKLSDEESKVGFLDLVGKDRLQTWRSLGDLSKEEAMKKYIHLIAKCCPLFHVHFEAHQRHLKEIEQNRIKLIEEEKLRHREMSEQKEKKLKEEDLKLLEENKKRREDIQRKQIQEALNQQTHPHFKAYAEQQHPSNISAQEELIKQLQEQHFEQYMNQVYQQQLLHQQQQAEQLRAMKRAQRKQEQQTLNGDQLKSLSINANSAVSQTYSSPVLPAQSITSQNQVNVCLISENETCETPQKEKRKSTVSASSSLSPAENNINDMLVSTKQVVVDYESSQLVNTNSININESSNKSGENSNNEGEDEEPDGEDEDEERLPPISAASMLTRKDLKEFKESVRRDNDAIIKVGSGETVTVRVPTHEDGRLIFWEFATDYYDIGFGLYFEWSISPSNNVTVHVSDSSEEDEGDDDEDPNKKDIEKGDKVVDSNKPPCDEIIPIFRRDSHEEVYAGSHLYPGRGVYLLKFDNSFSLWRSKTLYYRVYYSK